MADQPDKDDKTEEPSARRLREAREAGRAAQSRDWLAFAVMGSAFAVLFVAGVDLYHDLLLYVASSLRFDDILAADGNAAGALLGGLWQMLRMIALVGVPPLIAAVLAQLLLGGAHLSMKACAPDFKRLNPAQGLRRLFGGAALYELVKALLKTVLIMAVASAWLLAEAPRLPALLGLGASALTDYIGERSGQFVLRLLAVAGVMALSDAGFQWWRHRRDLRMTKQEVRDEQRQSEGSPEIRARLRRVQQELARGRATGSVRDATVVLTNPTHFLVGLRYEPTDDAPPMVCAKARGPAALALREEALAYDVPVQAQPALTRALYFTTEVGDHIPEELFQAVAVVLAYALNGGDGDLDEVEPPAELLFDEQGRRPAGTR